MNCLFIQLPDSFHHGLKSYLESNFKVYGTCKCQFSVASCCLVLTDVKPLLCTKLACHKIRYSIRPTVVGGGSGSFCRFLNN